jgi:ParB family chromosome partitioning protein
VERRSGLGRGLGALIPQDVTTDGADRPSVREVSISQIAPNRYQPRNHFDEESLAGLTASIRELGVLQPVLVREVAPDRFELIAGERRWRAAKRAGLQFMPIIERDVSDELTLQHALVENLHRDDLNPLEEAAAYQQLIEDFGMTQEAVAHRVGKSRSAIANLLRLFQLTPQVQRLVAVGLTVRETEEAVRVRTAAPPAPAPDSGAPGSKLRAPGLLELEELLADQLDTRVKINMGPKRGRVVIEFADLEDLERIYRVMSPVDSAPSA